LIEKKSSEKQELDNSLKKLEAQS